MGDTRVVLTIAVASVAAALVILSQILGLRRVATICTVAIALGLTIWVPESARDWIVAGSLFFVIALADEFMVGVVVALIALGFAALVPGGLSVAILAVLAIAAVLEMRKCVGHLMRLRRANRLAPGVQSGEVEVGGVVMGTVVAAPPGSEVQAVAWRAGHRELKRTSSKLLEVKTDNRSIYVDLQDVTMKLTSERVAHVRAPVHQVADLFGVPVPSLDVSDEPDDTADEAEERTNDQEVPGSGGDGQPHDGTNDAADTADFVLEWLAPGDEVYVVGIPSWEPAPAEHGGGYRDAPAVAVFRPQRTPVFVANRPEAELVRETVYTITAWVLWGSVCGVTAAFQFSL